MKNWLLAALTASALHAAVLRGTVVEQQTGKPLARALVAVHPVTGTAGSTQAVRTDAYGAFQFPPMPAGAYLVTISKKGFAPLQYGQRQWKSSGTPVMLRDDQETALRVALPRFGAITGRISDEADVGLVEHDVIAYRNTRPPVVVAKAATDDRGVYRIPGLEPGVYLVRTTAKQYDDGGYLPTFFKESATAERSNTVEVALDRDTVDVSIRPTPGRLYQIAGRIYGPGGPQSSAGVSLISDMGAEYATADTSGHFKFLPAAPGKYELFARVGQMAAWLPIEIDRDRTEYVLRLYPIPEVAFSFADVAGESLDPAGLLVIARRTELWGPGAPQYLPMGRDRFPLLPGNWEFSLSPNESYYTTGWTKAVIAAGPPAVSVNLTVGAHPGAVHGKVTGAAGDPSAGAPVYLEREGEIRSARTDIQGAYNFIGVAPGTYRLLSTFDAPNFASGRPVEIGQGSAIALDLTLSIRE